MEKELKYKVGDRVEVNPDHFKGRFVGDIISAGRDGYGAEEWYRVLFDGWDDDYLTWPTEIVKLVEGVQTVEEMGNPEFYYSTATPHKWSGGPVMHYWDNETGEKIASLERAKELALKARAGSWGELDFVETAFGVSYKTEGMDRG